MAGSISVRLHTDTIVGEEAGTAEQTHHLVIEGQTVNGPFVIRLEPGMARRFAAQLGATLALISLAYAAPSGEEVTPMADDQMAAEAAEPTSRIVAQQVGDGPIEPVHSDPLVMTPAQMSREVRRAHDLIFSLREQIRSEVRVIGHLREQVSYLVSADARASLERRKLRLTIRRLKRKVRRKGLDGT